MSNTNIDNFLGLNLNETGDTQLKLGEASLMKNFRITKDYKLDKMYGYKKKYSVEGIIRAQWVGLLGDKEVHVYVAGGKVYDGETEIGDLTDDITSIFEFNKVLYFINGREYKKWNGETFEEVEGYIPLIKIATEPNGVGTDYEPINMLISKRHQTFSPDGEATEFFLAEQNLTSIDKVLVNGAEVVVTKNLEKGSAKFETVLEQGVNSVDIYYTKENTDRDIIVKNHYFQKYGLANDTRVFLYGNSDAMNRIYYSDLGAGVPNVEYFPGSNFMDIGSSNTAVTSIDRQYDRLIISKENETYYATYEQITDTTGASIVSFPASPLNSSHGMVAKGQGQLLDNYVTTIDTSIVMWTNTQSKDERNAEVISQRIQEWLNEKDLTKAITMDYQEDKEYWLAVENQIMIYNYGNSTFYMLEIPSNISSLVSYKGVIYLGTENGEIMQFDENETTFNGEIIDALWHSGFYDFEIEYKRKTMRVIWPTIKPWFKTSMVINYISDRDTGTDEKEIENRCFSYPHWNYADFTYNTNYSVKPFRVKIKAKKFAFLKLIIRNNKIDEKLTITSLSIKKAYGGNVK